MGTGLGGRGLYQMVGRRRRRGAIGEEGAPVVVFLQPSPCPLNLLGLVDDLSPPSAWPVVMVIAKVFQQFLFASSLNVQLKEVWLVLDNIRKGLRSN